MFERDYKYQMFPVLSLKGILVGTLIVLSLMFVII